MNYKHVGELIRNKRINHPKKFSQAEISKFLGYQGGHLISDIERGLCDIPSGVEIELMLILGISAEELAEARKLDSSAS